MTSLNGLPNITHRFFSLSCVYLLSMLWALDTNADCFRNEKVLPDQASNDINIGDVIVPSHLENGSVIKVVTGNMPRIERAWRCDSNNRANNIKQAQLDCPKCTPDALQGAKIIPTAVPGIGIRISRYPLRRNTVYVLPYQITSVKNFSNLTASELVVEVIKTGDISPGPKLDNITFNFRGNGADDSKNLVFSSIIRWGSVYLAKSTCEISPNNGTVRLPNVNKNQFTQVGSQHGRTEFNLHLTCNDLSRGLPSGLNQSLPNPQLAYSFNYQTTGALSETGVLKNVLDNGASGVGIQLLHTSSDNGQLTEKPVVNSLKNSNCNYFHDTNNIGSDCSQHDEHWITVGTLNDIKDNTHTLNLIAQYYQTEATVTAGAVKAHSTFTLIYY